MDSKENQCGRRRLMPILSSASEPDPDPPAKELMVTVM